jgi:NAD-dependent dihydropyrimidine dehydrogenase PreA subunit
MVPHRPRARHHGPQWLSQERVGRTVQDPRLGALAIITEACIDVKDRACVGVCPVQCIYEFGPKNNALFSEDESGSGVTDNTPHRRRSDRAL